VSHLTRDGVLSVGLVCKCKSSKPLKILDGLRQDNELAISKTLRRDRVAYRCDGFNRLTIIE
jgi:hypothetical protein